MLPKFSRRPVRAAAEEAARPLPGDELIPTAIRSLTHAITIERSPSEVWPWPPDRALRMTWAFVLLGIACRAAKSDAERRVA